MKTYTSPLVFAAALLASSTTLHAESVIIPTHRILGGAWGGWSIDGEFNSYGPGANENYNRLVDTGVLKTATGTFHTTSSYIINSDWAGSFGISGMKTGSAAGISSDLNFMPNTVSQPTPGSIIDTLTSYSYISFNTAGIGSDYIFDFSTLDLGYLPAGTLIATAGRYNIGNAFTIGSNLNTEFLEYLGAEYVYDAGFVSAAEAEITFDDGVYNYEILSQIDPSKAVNGAPATFVTSANITSLTISANPSDAFSIHILAPVIQVPEPSGVLLLGLTGTLTLLRRRRSA